MPGLLDGLFNAAPAAPSGILGNLGAATPNQRVADAFGQMPPEMMAMLQQMAPQQTAGQPQPPPGLAQLLLGMMSPQGQAMPPGQAPQGPPLGPRSEAPMMSDETPYPVMPGQQYAAAKPPWNPLQGFSMIIPDPNAIAGGAGGVAPIARPVKGTSKDSGSAKATEKAFEQMRKENAGLTREQRREQMRIESEKEFNRFKDMSDAEWDALTRDALRRR